MKYHNPEAGTLL